MIICLWQFFQEVLHTSPRGSIQLDCATQSAIITNHTLLSEAIPSVFVTPRIFPNLAMTRPVF